MAQHQTAHRVDHTVVAHAVILFWSAKQPAGLLIFGGYTNPIQMEFDPVKDGTHLAKHRLSLGMGNELDWEVALVWVDDRFEYYET